MTDQPNPTCLTNERGNGETGLTLIPTLGGAKCMQYDYTVREQDAFW